MTETTYNGTIDWNRFWTEADEDARDGASPSALHAADALCAFLNATGVPETVADVGCGTGATAFAVAQRFPETTVVGYDAAPAVLEPNRERAHEEGLENVRFDRAVLPAFDPDYEFDVVFCYFTLCYVRDIERALCDLYGAVRPGGYLVFNYFNTLARAHYRAVAEAPTENIPEGSPFDPDRFSKRFRLTIEGDNLLSYDRAHDVLDTWPRSVWSVVEKPEKRWAWRHNPLVYVPKPA